MGQHATTKFTRYSFYKVDLEWRRLSQGDRERSKAEFADIVAESADRVATGTYSLVGTRGDVDFMIWKVSSDLDEFTNLAAKLNHTELGKYLHMPHSYLAMTRESPYVASHHHKGQEGSNTSMRIVGRKYLFIYPFTKTSDWYQLPKENRQRMMDEHFAIGHLYPSVKISTAYSFGLDNQEFVLGFETDEPNVFLDLVMKLRESKARPYTLRDTPIFTCVNKTLRDCLNDLG
jgi:chlorite dismutase